MTHSDAEWRKRLTPAQYAVLRQSATEPPFSGKLYHNHDEGTYRCAGCGNTLFSSATKFESGSGWPSFWAPIAEENIRKRTDASLMMQRVEVLCTHCDAHLGHLFDDGPPPTNLRYCINESSLRFILHKA